MSSLRSDRYWYAIRHVVLACVIVLPAAAQATRDTPTLTIGISAGWSSSTDFWHVPNQPITAPNQQFDIFDIERRLQGNLAFGFQATIFKKPNFGITGEVSYVGIGTKDSCRLAASTGYDPNTDACKAINRSDRSSSSTSFLIGGVVRPWSRAAIQPFLKLQGGISAVSDNLTSLTAFLGDNGTVEVYPSEGGLSMRPSGVLSLGVSTNFGQGFQFRLEARQTFLQLTTVKGPSAHDEIEPPKGTVFKSVSTLLIGFDVVLEKSRGRRY